MDSLGLSAASEDASVAVLDFSGTGTVVGAVEFAFAEGALAVDFGSAEWVELSCDGETIIISGEVGEAAFPMVETMRQPGGVVTVRLDLAGGECLCGDLLFDLAELSGASGFTNVMEVQFSNLVESAQVVSAIAVFPGMGNLFDEIEQDAEAQVAGERGPEPFAVEYSDDERFPVPVPTPLPPPHPYFVMAAQRWMLIAPGVAREGAGGSLHARPGIVRYKIMESEPDSKTIPVD